MLVNTTGAWAAAADATGAQVVKVVKGPVRISISTATADTRGLPITGPMLVPDITALLFKGVGQVELFPYVDSMSEWV